MRQEDSVAVVVVAAAASSGSLYSAPSIFLVPLVEAPFGSTQLESPQQHNLVGLSVQRPSAVPALAGSPVAELAKLLAPQFPLAFALVFEEHFGDDCERFAAVAAFDPGAWDAADDVSQTSALVAFPLVWAQLACAAWTSFSGLLFVASTPLKAGEKTKVQNSGPQHLN